MFSKLLILISLLYYLVPFQLYGQGERDTLYYELETDMIDQARIYKDSLQGMSYYTISIQLKKEYHSKFEQATDNNIGSILAIVHEGVVISPSLPIILTKIHRGRILVGKFKKEEKARKVMQKLLNQKEQ